MSKDFASKQFSAGSCYSYILSSRNEAVIIDPHISLLEEYAGYLTKKRLGLKYIMDTHTHADHFSLAAVLKKRYRAPVLMHEKAISSVADRRLKDNEEIAFGSCRCKVIYTPGHTDDAMSIYGEGRLFTGDVLLIGSVGRTDFQNGSPEAMFDTLQRLKALPDETMLFPAHDYHGNRSSTIAREKKSNPFLKETSKESFVKNARSKQLPKPFNIDNIIRVNQRGEASLLEMVSPEDARALASRDPRVILLDVRSPLEFNEVHIDHSLNIPIDTLASKVEDLSRAGHTYVVFCHSGNRSPMAADMLLQSGIHSVKVMDGGIARWQKEKLPVIKGEPAISLERQVRIIAGSVVLLGIVLARFVHGAFIWISILISCGLIFAGITNNCLMGMLLMRLPYNKKAYTTKTGGGTCSISQ
ncbi:MAG: MBL fold metallo-hydrolase [Candidatus Aureabacteria bacterium]|nr:MBL fold metallo-hydrolase [Candidatus Auribacterota bacterium]